MVMPTIDERREVAKALRGDPDDTLIPQVRDGFEFMTFHEAAYRFWDMCRRIKSAADVDIAHSTRSVLADLIDPTCEMVVKNGHACCGRCGHRLADECEVEEDYYEFRPFCPDCGARVTDGGER